MENNLDVVFFYILALVILAGLLGSIINWILFK